MENRQLGTCKWVVQLGWNENLNYKGKLAENHNNAREWKLLRIISFDKRILLTTQFASKFKSNEWKINRKRVKILKIVCKIIQWSKLWSESFISLRFRLIIYASFNELKTDSVCQHSTPHKTDLFSQWKRKINKTKLFNLSLACLMFAKLNISRW